jgi:hypothetical protein
MGSNNLFFFWMQEADKEGDAERCKKVHDILQGIDSAPSESSRPPSSAIS